MRQYDEDDAKELNAEEWQLDLLKLNPEYVYWGPHEDYMLEKGSGWHSRIIKESWEEFGPWQLNDLNECVNFYFSVGTDTQECDECDWNGYHPDAQQIVRTFYEHSCLPGETAWHDKITQDEVEALWNAGRLGYRDGQEPPTAEAVNAANGKRSDPFGIYSHDAINRCILIRTRCERLGIPVTCPKCDGNGYLRTSVPYVALTLWWLHPRKGCSRGIEIKNIQQAELPEIFAFLRTARDRNADRFSKIP